MTSNVSPRHRGIRFVLIAACCAFWATAHGERLPATIYTIEHGERTILTLRVVRLHPRQMTVVGLLSRIGPDTHLWPLAVSMR